MSGAGRAEPIAADLARTKGFSDAVFAIVITLLVLDLRPPQTPPGHLLGGLLDEWPSYLAYATSYAYVAVVWMNHKAAFARIRTVDWGLQWANLAVLATTALLPFPTAVLAQAVKQGNPRDERTAVAFYALVGVGLCSAWLWFFHYLATHHHLVDERVHRRFFGAERARAWVGVVLYLLSGALGALVAPVIALVVFPLLPLFYGVTSHGLHELPEPLRQLLHLGERPHHVLG
jgi:uncharacterized membrane protein